jgi:hypothetical protein
MKLECRVSSRKALSPWFINHSIFEQVVNISPIAASITDMMVKFMSEEVTHQLTCFPSVSARNTRATFLIVHQPFLQTPNKTSTLLE